MCCGNNPQKRRITQAEQKPSQQKSIVPAGGVNQQVSNYNNALQKQQAYNLANNPRKTKIYQ